MSKRLAGATVIAVLMLTVPEARAVEDEATRLANNFSHENLICAVYHSLVAQCIANRDPNDPLAASYRQTSTTFVERSVRWAKRWPLGKGVSRESRDRPTRHVFRNRKHLHQHLGAAATAREAM